VKDGKGGVMILESGVAFSFFSEEVHAPFVELVSSSMKKVQMKEPWEDCYDQVPKSKLPKVVFDLQNFDMDLPVKNYLSTFANIDQVHSLPWHS
jgi:hypothetical protein